MQKEDRTANIGRTAQIIIALVAAAIAAGLVVLSAAILVKGGSEVLKHRLLVTVLCVIASFVLFFALISIRALSIDQGQDSTQLMTVKGWRMLAASMLVVCLVTILFGHWWGVLVPLIIGGICLFKDPKFREVFASLFGVG